MYLDLVSCCVEVVVAPVAVHIPYTQSNIQNNIKVAAQNCWVKGNGAFTGEIRYIDIAVQHDLLEYLLLAHALNICALQDF